jgi:hypothetical protein
MPRPVRVGTLVCALIALAGLILASSIPAAGAKTTAAVPQGFVGVNLDGPMFPAPASGVNLPQQLATMESDGVESIRVVFNWAAAQPYKSWSRVPAADTGNFVTAGGVPTDFAPIDQIVGLAAAEGISVLPTVVYAPAWDATGANNVSFARPARTAPYASFLKDLIARYGPHGSFWAHASVKLPIRRWQIWNEPDVVNFWPKQPFASTYVSLLAAAHKAVRQADPGAKVVLAGLTNYSWKDLEKIYKVRGARSDFDEVAIHPYTAKPAGVITILQYARNVMRQNGDAAKPIVADEIGWTSSHGQGATGVAAGISTTEPKQASNLAAVLPMLAADRTKLKLAAFDVYTWAGDEVPGSFTFNFAGLLRYSNGTLTEKPAYSAFVKAALAMEHCRRKGATASRCAAPS